MLNKVAKWLSNLTKTSYQLLILTPFFVCFILSWNSTNNIIWLTIGFCSIIIIDRLLWIIERRVYFKEETKDDE